MKAFVALGQGWSKTVRMERANFARLFASLGIGTFTTAQNPVFLREEGIPILTSLKGVTDVFLYTMQVDAFGGVLNKYLVSDDHALSRFEGRIWHLAVDTKIPVQSLHRWSQYKRRPVEGTQDWVAEVHCLSQARNTDALLKGYEKEFKKFAIRPVSVQHVPLELNRAFFKNFAAPEVKAELPLIHIGGDRQGKRTKVLGEFLSQLDDKVALVGNVTPKFKTLYPDITILDAQSGEANVCAAYRLGKAALAFGDPGYEKLKHYTPRLYEAPLAGRLTIIHEDFIHGLEGEFPASVWPRFGTPEEALSLAEGLSDGTQAELIAAQQQQLRNRSHELLERLSAL